MERTLADVEVEVREKEAAEAKPKKQKYRKEKPWDNENVDHWKIDKFEEEDNKGGGIVFN